MGCLWTDFCIRMMCPYGPTLSLELDPGGSGWCQLVPDGLVRPHSESRLGLFAFPDPALDLELDPGGSWWCHLVSDGLAGAILGPLLGAFTHPNSSGVDPGAVWSADGCPI
jgi:hypothetical protein